MRSQFVRKEGVGRTFVGTGKEAAIVSTLVGFVGGHLSLMTTTRGPGVSGIFVVSSGVELPCSFIVIIPEPP